MLISRVWLMLISISLYRLGVLQGQRSSGFYVRMALTSYGIVFIFDTARDVLAFHRVGDRS